MRIEVAYYEVLADLQSQRRAIEATISLLEEMRREKHPIATVVVKPDVFNMLSQVAASDTSSKAEGPDEVGEQVRSEASLSQ